MWGELALDVEVVSIFEGDTFQQGAVEVRFGVRPGEAKPEPAQVKVGLMVSPRKESLVHEAQIMAWSMPPEWVRGTLPNLSAWERGWGSRIRTSAYGSRVRCPTTRRTPSGRRGILPRQIGYVKQQFKFVKVSHVHPTLPRTPFPPRRTGREDVPDRLVRDCNHHQPHPTGTGIAGRFQQMTASLSGCAEGVHI